MSSIDDLKGWVNLRLDYRLKGCFSSHCDITQFMLTYSVLNRVNIDVLDGTLWERHPAARVRPKVSWHRLPSHMLAR